VYSSPQWLQVTSFGTINHSPPSGNPSDDGLINLTNESLPQLSQIQNDAGCISAIGSESMLRTSHILSWISGSLVKGIEPFSIEQYSDGTMPIFKAKARTPPCEVLIRLSLIQ
jgi:hypothetical protein